MKKIIQISILLIIILGIGVIFNSNTVQAYTKQEYAQKLEESVSYAISLIDDKMTDHEKALIFTQYCQEGNIYSGNGQTATDVFVDHKAVCAGYAESFKLLCETVGIPCETLSSYKANHKWCVCYLDGEWTYVDVTRGSSGKYAPQDFSGKFFCSKDEFDFVKVEGGMYTSAKIAKENGWTIIESQYFTDAYYDSYGLNNNYYPEGSSWSDSKITGNYSRIYYDENYRYYEQAPSGLGATEMTVYKENRTTGEKTELAKAFLHNNLNSGLVKDNNKIYYVATDGKTIYSMDLNGNNKTKEFEYTGDNVVSGIFVQDGYIYYVLRDKSTTSTSSEWTKWKELETRVQTGKYTINNSTFSYIQTRNGITITDYEGPENVTIPNTINGKAVTRIGNSAFEDKKLTGELTLPKFLKSIGDDGFYNNQITKINFNNGLEVIGNYAFYNCTNLSGTLDMSNKVKSLGRNAFGECNYTTINLSSSLKTIGYMAFSWNRELTGVQEFPEGIIVIGRSAFSKTKLNSAILPSTLESLGKDAFSTLSDAFESVAIKSKKMKSFYGSDAYEIYLINGTETSKYADTNNITYKDLNTATPNIEFTENAIKLQVGKEGKQLSYTITPKFFEKMGTVKWSTSNSNVVTVSKTGEITPVSVGTANVYLTLNNNQAVCSVTVEKQYLKGDVNGDGKINIKDWNILYAYINETMTLSSEELQRADVNEDGKINVKDLNRLYEHITETNPLD